MAVTPTSLVPIALFVATEVDASHPVATPAVLPNLEREDSAKDPIEFSTSVALLEDVNGELDDRIVMVAGSEKVRARLRVDLSGKREHAAARAPSRPRLIFS